MFCMNIVREEVKVTVTSMLRLQGQRRLILVPTRKLSQQIKFTSNLHQFPGNPSTIIYQSWILTESTHRFVGYTMQLRSFPGLSTAYHLYRVDRDLDALKIRMAFMIVMVVMTIIVTLVVMTLMIVMIKVMLLTTMFFFQCCS